MVTSEAVPFSKSGGLADVVGSLPIALNAKGQDCRIIVPAYNTAVEDAGKAVCKVSVKMLSSVEEVEIRLKTVNKVKYYFVCHPYFCDRKGIYGNTSFEPYADNFDRFSVLCKVALELCPAIKWKPDVIHCHDWTAGLLPYFLKEKNSPYYKDTKTVFTIHNLAYQGTFQRMDYLMSNEKPHELLFRDGQVNMLKAGVAFSDFITTVSPTYAKEIQGEEQGCGLDDLLRKRKSKLKGIVNGIDVKDWDPLNDPNIPFHFSAAKPANKADVKAAVQKEFNLPRSANVPLFAMISRLASQKGFDAVIPCLETMLRTMKIQFVIIGTGDSRIERELQEIASRNENLSVNILFSNKAAHMVEAGADFFLMPSRYEPCGLNQLYSLRYGTIPIVRKTGGLADTVIDLDERPDDGTGLVFEDLNSDEIVKHVKRAVELYHRDNFKNVVNRAMKQDFSWSASAAEYIKVYEKITKGNKKGGRK